MHVYTDMCVHLFVGVCVCVVCSVLVCVHVCSHNLLMRGAASGGVRNGLSLSTGWAHTAFAPGTGIGKEADVKKSNETMMPRRRRVRMRI